MVVKMNLMVSGQVLWQINFKGKTRYWGSWINQRLSNINEIFDITSKPLIMDVDTGGKLEHLN